jgi:hypothetical protein
LGLVIQALATLQHDLVRQRAQQRLPALQAEVAAQQRARTGSRLRRSRSKSDAQRANLHLPGLEAVAYAEVALDTGFDISLNMRSWGDAHTIVRAIAACKLMLKSVHLDLSDPLGVSLAGVDEWQLSKTESKSSMPSVNSHAHTVDIGQKWKDTITDATRNWGVQADVSIVARGCAWVSGDTLRAVTLFGPSLRKLDLSDNHGVWCDHCGHGPWPAYRQQSGQAQLMDSDYATTSMICHSCRKPGDVLVNAQCTRSAALLDVTMLRELCGACNANGVVGLNLVLRRCAIRSTGLQELSDLPLGALDVSFPYPLEVPCPEELRLIRGRELMGRMRKGLRKKSYRDRLAKSPGFSYLAFNRFANVQAKLSSRHLASGLPHGPDERTHVGPHVMRHELEEQYSWPLLELHAQCCGLRDHHLRAIHHAGIPCLQRVDLTSNPYIKKKTQEDFRASQQRLLENHGSNHSFELVAETLTWLQLLQILVQDLVEHKDKYLSMHKEKHLPPTVLSVLSDETKHLNGLASRSLRAGTRNAKEVRAWVAGVENAQDEENRGLLAKETPRGYRKTLAEVLLEPVDTIGYGRYNSTYDENTVRINGVAAGEGLGNRWLQEEEDILERATEVGQFLAEHLSDHRRLFTMLQRVAKRQREGIAGKLKLVLGPTGRPEDVQTRASNWSGEHIEQLRRSGIHIAELSLTIDRDPTNESSEVSLGKHFRPFSQHEGSDDSWDDQKEMGSESHKAYLRLENAHEDHNIVPTVIDVLRIGDCRDEHLGVIVEDGCSVPATWGFARMVIRRLEVPCSRVTALGWQSFVDRQERDVRDNFKSRMIDGKPAFPAEWGMEVVARNCNWDERDALLAIAYLPLRLLDITVDSGLDADAFRRNWTWFSELDGRIWTWELPNDETKNDPNIFHRPQPAVWRQRPYDFVKPATLVALVNRIGVNQSEGISPQKGSRPRCKSLTCRGECGQHTGPKSPSNFSLAMVNCGTQLTKQFIDAITAVSLESIDVTGCEHVYGPDGAGKIAKALEDQSGKWQALKRFVPYVHCGPEPDGLLKLALAALRHRPMEVFRLRVDAQDAIIQVAMRASDDLGT